MINNKPTILTFVAYYLPGYKSGGPVRTIANLVDHLGDEFDFKIVTLDRDALDTEPYPDIEINKWNQVGNAQVFYASPAFMTLRNVSRLIRQTPHDVLYLNSFFSFRFSILPLVARRFGLLPDKPVVLAPRGEFSQGALALKKSKKNVFLHISKLLGLYKNIRWQASSEHEKDDILRSIGGGIARDIFIAPNLPQKPKPQDDLHHQPRKPGDPLRIVFLSRITPMKNLEYALKILEKVSVPAVFNIFGPVRDEQYWTTCQRILSRMPSNIRVKSHGAVSPAEVPAIMSGHDLFLLPTLGENYGHVISEALSVGTPVLIADTTPWRGLEEAGAGWDLSLSKESDFVRCIEQSFYLSKKEYMQWRKQVKMYASQRLSDPRLIQANRELFLFTRNEQDVSLFRSSQK